MSICFIIVLSARSVCGTSPAAFGLANLFGSARSRRILAPQWSFCSAGRLPTCLLGKPAKPENLSSETSAGRERCWGTALSSFDV